MEDDEEALKEDEGQPGGTLGTEVCPRTPSKSAGSSPVFCGCRRSFGGRAVRHVTVSVSRRVARKAGGPPRRLTEMVIQRARGPKNSACDCKIVGAEGKFRGGPWANLGS